MEEMIEDVKRVTDRLIPILGNNFYNLFDENDIFEFIEERDDEPSEMRVDNIVQNILTNYDIEIEKIPEKSSLPCLNNNLEPSEINESQKNAAANALTVPDIRLSDHHSLVQHLSCMFPETSVEYIWTQAKNIVGHAAAIERFTDQLLENPHPPLNWSNAEILLECECCYTETRQDDLISCPTGHTFCHQCVKRATSVALGDGRSGVKCMAQCTDEITWRQLGIALDPTVLLKLEQRRQVEEVNAAGIDKLVSCPFCPYQAIMEDSEDKLFVCMNSECLKESCRKCGKISHVPLRCDELPEVEGARKKIEEELSMAMLRQCWQCKKMFYKESGCNRMTCICGAQMCYLCKLPVTNYDHFYGQGGEPGPGKQCPLFQDDQELHRKEVSAAAQKAKEELSLAGDLARVLTVDVSEGKVMVE